MSVHYYFSWFEKGFPQHVIEKMSKDIQVRKSLVLISGHPKQELASDYLIKSWFEEANLKFENYDVIDEKISKEEAVQKVEEASVIFLCGGYADLQNDFLTAYGLMKIIQNSSSVIMGASAGAINMSSRWLASKNTNIDVQRKKVFNGLGLDELYFSTKINQSINDSDLLSELEPISYQTDIYMAINEVAMRSENGQLEFLGEVYLMKNSVLKKMKEIF